MKDVKARKHLKFCQFCASFRCHTKKAQKSEQISQFPADQTCFVETDISRKVLFWHVQTFLARYLDEYCKNLSELCKKMPQNSCRAYSYAKTSLS